LLGRVRNESSNEPQQEVTARNIFGLLCRFVTRLFHTIIYSGITGKKILLPPKSTSPCTPDAFATK
jgi:hypothetical protein